MNRWRRAIHAFFLIAAALLVSAESWAEELGVASVKPDEGRYVEADGQYLVAYKAVVPGSDVSFWMEPIPSGLVRTTDPKSGETVDVELAPYWIGRCEVTWAEYKQFMKLCALFEKFDDRGIRPITEKNRIDAITAPSKLYDPGFTFGSGDKPNLPAVSMTQYAAKQYTKWLSLLTGQFYRLPSDAEWGHACRAGTETAYSFGESVDQIDDYAWHEDNSDFETQIVAQKAPNAWGLYDMHGNTSEWVLDAPEVPASDPDGPGGEPPIAWPKKLYPRTLRGGSAFLPIDECQTDSRRASDDKEWKDYDPNTPKSPWWFANDDAQDVGFRIIRPLHIPPRDRQARYWDADNPRIIMAADFRIDEEGRGKRGVVDPDLPNAIEQLNR
jgi:sulfatase modifying factor 1